MMPTRKRAALVTLCAALTLTGCGSGISATDAGCGFYRAHEHLTRPVRSDTPETIDNLVIYREGMEAACRR